MSEYIQHLWVEIISGLAGLTALVFGWQQKQIGDLRKNHTQCTTSTHERLARLETGQEYIKEAVDEIRADVRVVKKNGNNGR